MKDVSTGISIASINRIKELAEEKKYKEALEILDTQNLDKSINPQFLRISGEIFRENKRYYDSRRILLKAHEMAPQGIRIIFELIQLYLELGYFTLAKRYYEQYMYYSTLEDTQRDYVEYIMKKATGSDVKELASILIPILERMPEDKWNFEAILLYDKMGRKDKALEESQYILENFKDSVFVQPVIDYIDERLDVDACFYTYPKTEMPEDEDLFGDLVEMEDRILENDYLRMHPPEARIMVDVEDKEGIDAKSTKEKKSKRRRLKRKKTANQEETAKENAVEGIEKVENAEENEKTIISEQQDTSSDEAVAKQTDTLEDAKENEQVAKETSEKEEEAKTEEPTETEEERIRKEREAALEKLMSRKIDTEQIKESARQAAKAVKDIEKTKAVTQMKSVAETVKDNVKKATGAIEEAVGAKAVKEEINSKKQEEKASTDKIVDGIIESVLEPPKKVVGEVVTNEELDALIPDSLEAMSAQEIADLEAKKEEAERLELEALEAQLKLEEKKKSRRRFDKLFEDKEEKQEETTSQEDNQTDKTEDTVSEGVEEIKTQEKVTEDKKTVTGNKEEYEKLKTQFLADMNDEVEPLDSLGYDTSMIDTITIFSDSGFEVEDYDFDTFQQKSKPGISLRSKKQNKPEEVFHDEASVQRIFAQEDIMDFDDIVPNQFNILDVTESEPVQEGQPILLGPPMEEVEHTQEQIEQPIVQVDLGYMPTQEEEHIRTREKLRVRIILSDSMVRKLLVLKESR